MSLTPTNSYLVQSLAVDNPNKQFIAIIQADGMFTLDWQTATVKLDSRTHALQAEIVKHAREHEEKQSSGLSGSMNIVSN